MIRFADASLAAFTIISSSTRCCARRAAVWTMNMSAPRTDSSKRQYVSPSANVFSVTAPSSTPRWLGDLLGELGMRAARDDDEPLRRRSAAMRAPTAAGLRCRPASPSPGSASIVRFPPRPSLTVCRGAKPDERVVGDVVGDDGSRRRPNVVANSDRSNEHSVDGDPDVAPDRRPALRRPGSCGKLAVIEPAPMFDPSPISASPMYERCGTFAPSPIRDFLISTNVPAFAPRSRTVPGRR